MTIRWCPVVTPDQRTTLIGTVVFEYSVSPSVFNEEAAATSRLGQTITYIFDPPALACVSDDQALTARIGHLSVIIPLSGSR